jgi:hypothetical protein
MPTPSVPLRARRAALLAAVIVLALVGCQPAVVPPAPSPTTVTAPGGAALGVVSPALARGTTVAVPASGCADDFQYVEVRLVVGTGAQRRSLHVTTASGGDPAELAVPAWAPDGPAELEGSCLEPNFSHASDGADVRRFDYPAVPVTVGGPAPAAPAPSVSVPATVSDGTLEVAGTGCSGRVLVGVAPGLVPSASRFHHGRTLVTAAPDGSWSVSVPLSYRVGSFTDPAAPGPLTAFAVCEGWWYAPAPFEVAAASPAPAVHLVGPTGDLVGVTQCPAYNTLSLLGLITLASGATSAIGYQVPGSGYGEHLYPFTLPAGTVAVVWHASCQGAHPSFVYAPRSWSAP